MITDKQVSDSLRSHLKAASRPITAQFIFRGMQWDGNRLSMSPEYRKQMYKDIADGLKRPNRICLFEKPDGDRLAL